MTKYFDDLCREVNLWITTQKTTPWIFLSGDLGAGKTTFTGVLLAELAFDPKEVQSPTFLKVIAYKNKQNETALHMDAYRIEEVSEFLRMGLEDYDNLRVGIVEWPAKFEEFLTLYPAFKETLEIKNVLAIELSSDHQVIKVQARKL